MNTIRLHLDRPRNLALTMGALRKVKAAAALPVHALLLGMTMLDPDAIVHVLWAALIHEDPSLTPDQVTDLVDVYLQGGGDLETLVDVLDQVVVASRVIRREELTDDDAKAILRRYLDAGNFLETLALRAIKRGLYQPEEVGEDPGN